ncbi:MAG: serine hydrolase domain-containing protein, partial [Kordiimonas sp.]
MIHALRVISATLLLYGCSQEGGDVIPKTSNDYRNDFVKEASKLLKDSDTPGVAVAIVKGDGRKWTYGFGYEDLENQKPMTENTVISIGSVSKIVTGFAAMQAVEKGLLDLDESVNSYLPF